MFPAEKDLQARLMKRQAEDACRELSCADGLTDFCSNDYLGFATGMKLQEKIVAYYHASKDAHHKTGSTGSRMISGNTAFAEKLEYKIACFHGQQAGLIYNSGYDANIGLFSAIPQRGDTVVYDELVHASIRDGIRLGFAHSCSFRHNDPDDLANIVKKARGRVFIAVESVYSMDGDRAPLKEIAAVARQHEAHLVVDEAHAVGLFGVMGRGLVDALGLRDQVFAVVYTFGKALGCHGGIITGSMILRDALINFSRSFIYTTALPFHSLLSVSCAYEMLKEADAEKSQLAEHIEYFKHNISLAGIVGLIDSDSAIQALVIPGNARVRQVAIQLKTSGYHVKPILSPTVPAGSERLRISLHAFNRRNEIDGLLQALAKAFMV